MKLKCNVISRWPTNRNYHIKSIHDKLVSTEFENKKHHQRYCDSKNDTSQKYRTFRLPLTVSWVPGFVEILGALNFYKHVVKYIF